MTAPAARNVRVDESEVNTYIQGMETIQADFKKRKGELAAVYDAAVKEASQHTADGKPAPIYVEPLAALKSRVDYMSAQFDQIDKNITADNKALRDYVAKSKSDSEETAAKIKTAVPSTLT